jgi:hypothetical protein
MMVTDRQVQIVARAMCDAEGVDPDQRVLTMGDSFGARWRDYRERARTILIAEVAGRAAVRALDDGP